MKKIIIISSIILGILAILVGVYFAWEKTKSILTPPSVGQQPTTANQQPTASGQQAALIAAAQKLKILSDQPIFDYWIFNSTPTSTAASSTPSNNKIFYLMADGKIFVLKEDGKSEAVTSDPISNLQAIKSSSDGKRVIIKSGDFTSPQFIIFNSETKIFELLPENITAATFSPDAKKIAYLEKSSGNLIIKDLIGTKPKSVKILSFNQKDFDLEWILPEKIILFPKASAFYPASAWSVDTKNKTIASLTTEISGLMIKWSTDGKIGLEFLSQFQGTVRSLNLIDNKGSIQANLDFMTLPDKCLIAEPKIYCAIPQNIPAKTILPDDYLKRAVYFQDSFYQIDITQNSFSEILGGTELTIDAVNLKLINNKLFFVNRYDNKLYSLDL